MKNFIKNNFVLRYWPFLVISLVGILLYFKTIFFNLTYLDDNVWILDYQWFIKDIKNVTQFFRYPDLVSGTFYRPLLNLSFMINAIIIGDKPWFYHLTNIGIHIFNGCLIFSLLKKLGYEQKVSLSATLIFIVHPVLTTAIAWIPGRTDSLLAMFILLSVVSFINCLDKRRMIDGIAHVVFFACGLLVKETAIITPVICFLYMALIRKSAKAFFCHYRIMLGWGAVVGCWFFLRKAFVVNLQNVSLTLALQSMRDNLSSFVTYFGKIFLPVNLSVLPVVKDLPLVYGIISIVVVAVFVAASKQKRWNYVLFGSLWFVLFLLPSLVISFLNHEYRLYLPLIGVLILVLEIDIVKILFQTKKLWMVIVGALVMLLGAVTLDYQDAFKDRLVFWSNAVKNSPHSPLAHRNLGAMYFLEGLFEKADLEFREALKLNPYEVMCHNNLGLIYMNKKMYRESEQEFIAELTINPTYDNGYYNLGVLYLNVNMPDRAALAWKKALELNNKYVAAYRSLVVLYIDQKDFAQANYYAEELRKRGIPIPANIQQVLDAIRK